MARRLGGEDENCVETSGFDLSCGCGTEDKEKGRKRQICGKEKDLMNKNTEGSKKRKYRWKEDAVNERIYVRRVRLEIETWNVRSLNKTRRLEEVEREIKRF